LIAEKKGQKKKIKKNHLFNIHQIMCVNKNK